MNKIPQANDLCTCDIILICIMGVNVVKPTLSLLIQSKLRVSFS